MNEINPQANIKELLGRQRLCAVENIGFILRSLSFLRVGDKLNPKFASNNKVFELLEKLKEKNPWEPSRGEDMLGTEELVQELNKVLQANSFYYSVVKEGNKIAIYESN